MKDEKDIKITVGMMTYNNADYISEAINSVLNQKYSNWELFIVDDCSSDNTSEIIDHYLDDPRITYIRHKTNKGQSATWKHVLNLGGGHIVGTLHADDHWDENMLTIVADSFMKHQDLDLFFSNWTFIGSSDTGPVEDKFGSGLDFLKDEIEFYTILPSASFLSKRVIEQSPSPVCDYRAAVDTYYFYRILLHAQDVKSCKRALTNYRMHDNNETTVSRSTGYVYEECIDNLRNIQKERKISHLSGLINSRIAIMFLLLGIQRIKFGDATNTWNYIGRALKSNSLGCIKNRNFYRLLFYHTKALVSN
ncbi:hypothetical protein MHTCC0001_29280 [Flavobacteriaceae bacterium MHTCC 0001]